jgi:ATP-dependent RNA helicase RhlE
LSFTDLLLAEPILRAVVSEGYTVATPVQAQAIPHVLSGRDVLGCAQTGTGKTAAFALPILHRLHAAPKSGGGARPRCLVLCPTRELAVQIGESFRVYGKHAGLRHTVVYGGVGIRPQIDALRRGVDIVIATPGRLLDLMGQRCADLRAVEVLVLDEADRMLDMGFIHDIKRIIGQLPEKRQTLMFSATMPPEIRKLAGAILRDPANVQVARGQPEADGIAQSVYHVKKPNKPALLAHLVNQLPMTRAIVFTRTKRGADRLVRQLQLDGIRAEAVHGNKSQNARQRAMQNFRAGKMPLLVATDVASRGLDLDGITHVVNYDVTDEPETYIHRIGRTARAGAAGAAVSLCSPDEMPNLKAIERLLGKAIPVKHDQPAYAAAKPAEQHREPRAEIQRQPHRAPQMEVQRPPFQRPQPAPQAQPTARPANWPRRGGLGRPHNQDNSPGGGVRSGQRDNRTPRPAGRPHFSGHLMVGNR